LIHDIDSYKIVFVDGQYASHLSKTTHEAIDVCLMSSALNKSKYQAVIENYFNKIAEKNGLNALNTAFCHEGAYIHIKRNKLSDRPDSNHTFFYRKRDSYVIAAQKLNRG